MKIRKAIIPAAGLGTRFLPATKAQPKEMLPIVDKPTIQYIVEEAVQSGVQDIIIVTGRNKRSIEDHFDKSIELELELEKKGKDDLLEIARSVSEIANIHYIRQKEPRGLGHAILMAKHFIGNEPFAVLLGDDVIVSKKPCLQQMIDVYSEYRTSILGVQKVPINDVSKYGIIDAKHIEDRIYKIKDLVEKPLSEDAPSNIAILGRYIISPSIFKYLETQEAGAGGEIQLTDSLKRLARDEAIYAYDFIGKRYDVGNIMGFLQATVESALRRDELRDNFLEYLKYTINNIDNIIKVD
ncbi:UTP--glucose-1-phosphate uridylyltransferase GalU [Vallitalea sp.]|jgi:UTP--glucose-1-phosphate uridylyltransferase|uniref:UTP--glucose-1-phosphate uridylyltransferase GalU n=1 Tax=Vallitalea sp. TaxID=1882829 RepID=UPI0025CDB6A5|nr:UTP--glucose-1-phosphate uridylyltransferase GalU [Vallitalea sp.]MCT4688654.1 UTP--glucose-1-phosphate uridylyltransferase GalU [Vallitalea sp.]